MSIAHHETILPKRSRDACYFWDDLLLHNFDDRWDGVMNKFDYNKGIIDALTALVEIMKDTGINDLPIIALHNAYDKIQALIKKHEEK